MAGRVIVIDDSRSLREYTLGVLDHAGFEAFGASDGPTGLESVKKNEPDVVLLDVIMPGMSGMDVLKQLRKDKVLVSILLFTTMSSVSRRVEGLKAGADDYVVKPFQDEELIARVGSAARRTALEKNLVKLVDARTRDFVKKERQAVFGQMVQGIIHNINNPLAVVSGFSEIAKRKLLKYIKGSEGMIDQAGMELLKNITDNMNKMLSASDMVRSIINNLLEKSRDESIEYKQKIDLNELITQEVDFLEAGSKLKHTIKIDLDLDPSIMKIFGIYTDFSQVMSNLIKNAFDAMMNSPKKELGICTKHDSENIYVLVKDTGEGISSANIEHIFDPFFTTKACKDKKENEETGGTGLGLCTCKLLLKSYHADISVKSLDTGSLFAITIPKTNVFTQRG